MISSHLSGLQGIGMLLESLDHLPGSLTRGVPHGTPPLHLPNRVRGIQGIWLWLLRVGALERAEKLLLQESNFGIGTSKIS